MAAYKRHIDVRSISDLTVARLSIYLRCVDRLLDLGIETVSSQELARRFNLNSAQIRKDLAYFGEFGVRGVGYNVRELREYVVEILGFPHPGGVRAEDGAPLDRTWRWRFRTVDLDEPRTGFVFEDPTPGFAQPIVLESGRISPGEPLALVGLEPLDPSSVFAEDFELRRARTLGAGVRPELDENGDPLLGEPLPLTAYLADNRPPDEDGTGRMRLVLLPPARLDPGLFQLRIDQYGTRDPTDPERLLSPGLRLRDFGGNKVLVRNPSVSQTWWIEVVPTLAGEPAGLFREEFLDAAMRSSQEVGGADGTARWSTSGRVEVAFPAAAGDGRDGVQVLDDVVGARDVQATRLRVPVGARARIEAQRATVVLRAQGRLEIDGRLERREPGDPLAFDADGPVALSDWLAAADGEESGWTVLVAGGDLVVTGEIRVPGGLLLVAGGRVRVTGQVHAWRDRPELDPWVLGEGGGRDLVLQDAGRHLFADPPATNVLREPQTWAVLSGPIPSGGGVLRWRESSTGIHAGTGTCRVRFVGSDAAGVHLDGAQAVEHPGLLSSSPYLRLLIDLTVPAGPADGGEAWDPPALDFAEVTWDRARPEGER